MNTMYDENGIDNRLRQLLQTADTHDIQPAPALVATVRACS